MSFKAPVGRSSLSWLFALAVVLLGSMPFLGTAQEPAPAPATRPDRSPVDLRREYRERFAKLRADDVEAHYQLAEWLHENKAYPLLLRQSQYVLQLSSGHENAQLLYRLAAQQLRAQNAQTRAGDAPAEVEGLDGELLTPAQIQRLKFAEFLDADQLRETLPAQGRRPRAAQLREEFLQVRFATGLLNEFLDLMSGHQDFDSREDRTAFLTLSPTRQTQLIRQHTGDRFQDDLEIVNDPLVFNQFQRVLPMVMSGCATSACHGGPAAEGWRLRTVRPRSDRNLYTNFLILNRAGRGHQGLINRPLPEDSLLLHYGLPPQQSTWQHPEPIPVMFPRGREDLRYRAILAWIQNLSIPEPRTGVSLPGYPEPPPPQIGGKPREQADPAAPAER